jgi:hypothetical protein
MATELPIGKLIEGNGARDAIHIAIAPVTAGEYGLRPGTLIGFTETSGDEVCACKDGIGIVDPFLQVTPGKGQRFYMFLLPNTITSLRHEWTHPAFASRSGVEVAEAWLKNYALTVARTYDAEHGADYCYQKFMVSVRDGEIFYYGNDCHGAYEVEHAEELYANLSIVLGRAVGPDNFTFSCSC